MGYDAVERFQQCGDLSFPPVELLRNDQSIRGILFAGRKFVDVMSCLPRCKALTKIGLDTRGSLVTLLRRLREELHHHRRELAGHRLCTIARRDRLSGKVAMDQFDGIGRSEGEHTSQ